MKKQLAATLIIFVFPFFFVACVSSLFKETPPTFSREISVTEPSQPFVRTKTSVFPTWKSQKTGNVISIISDCDKNSNKSLAQLHRIVEDNLVNIKVLQEEGSFLNEKPALKKMVSAEVDGSPIEILSLSFRRKSCGYVSSLSGRIGQIEQESKLFEQFNQNLKFE